MNTESPEYKNVRELVAKHLWYENTRSRLTWDSATDKRKLFWHNKADHILLIKGILIEADDQRLPDVFDKETTAIFPVKKEANTVQRDMLKSGFRRVV